jgi:tRNA1Val (adenine37-N6)-methyltransferase
VNRNPLIPYTYKYSQPEEYHFSLDSIEMAWAVAEDLKARALKADKNFEILDLCCGCGVIGFELNFHWPSASRIDFVDVQEAYRSHFDRNRALVLTPVDFRFYNINYEVISTREDFKGKYHLILCNPPYFDLRQGPLSPSDLKNRSRFFMDSTFEKLILSLHFALAPFGEAFVLIRDLSDHGIDNLAELRRLCENRLTLQPMKPIRGTFLIRLTRSN